jgi:serine/threonine protein kinase
MRQYNRRRSMIQQLAHYKILERIGGESREVFRGRDTRTGRTVTIIVLPEELTADRENRERLFRAADTAAALSHPNIAALYHIGEEQGRVFLVFEFVAGETLTAAIGGRAMNVRRALDLAAQVGDALAEAQAGGVVHRHLSPETILVTPRGHAKLLYVGLWPWAREDGATLSAADERGDVARLGALLVEMLTGAPAAASPSALNPVVPHQVDRIVARALATDAGHRYASPAALVADLRAVIAAIDAQREASERTRT